MNNQVGSCSALDTIYLDNNATTRMAPEVADTMSEALRARYANPASQHREGRRARAAIEAASDRIAQLLDCRREGMSSDRILFTSGGTEANNLALLGVAAQRPGVVITTSIEHPSVLTAAEKLRESFRRDVIFLKALTTGKVSLEDWRAQFKSLVATDRKSIALVSCMLANNETGVLQPVSQIAMDCRRSEIPLHVDAVQVAGKLPLSFRELNADLLTITAHKIHGPVGIGALILRNHVKLEPQLLGGFQQQSLRPGTESVPLVIGFAKALEIAVNALEERRAKMESLRQRLEERLLQSKYPPVIIGCESTRLPHTISLAFPGINRQAFQMALDRAGIACSTGSACASGSGTSSHVLRAMNLSPDVIDGAIRLSLSWETSESDIEIAAHSIIEFRERLS